MRGCREPGHRLPARVRRAGLPVLVTAVVRASLRIQREHGFPVREASGADVRCGMLLTVSNSKHLPCAFPRASEGPWPFSLRAADTGWYRRSAVPSDAARRIAAVVREVRRAL